MLVYSFLYVSKVSASQCHSLLTILACLCPTFGLFLSFSGTPLILSQIRRLCSASPQTLGLSPRQRSWTASTSSGTISPSSLHKEVITGLHLSQTVWRVLVHARETQKHKPSELICSVFTKISKFYNRTCETKG